MADNPSKLKGDALPVTMISWNECQEFCEKTGLTFPTEAQWEYSCRAGTTTRFWSGDDDKDLDRVGWHGGNLGHKLHSVGEKPANGFGLYDMHGNVWEWCEDVWDEGFYEKPESTQKNPVCTSGSEHRVLRVVCFAHVREYCRSAFRFSSGPSAVWHVRGFRPTWSSP